jgi:hypothetical protein
MDIKQEPISKTLNSIFVPDPTASNVLESAITGINEFNEPGPLYKLPFDAIEDGEVILAKIPIWLRSELQTNKDDSSRKKFQGLIFITNLRVVIKMKSLWAKFDRNLNYENLEITLINKENISKDMTSTPIRVDSENSPFVQIKSDDYKLEFFIRGCFQAPRDIHYTFGGPNAYLGFFLMVAKLKKGNQDISTELNILKDKRTSKNSHLFIPFIISFIVLVVSLFMSIVFFSASNIGLKIALPVFVISLIIVLCFIPVLYKESKEYKRELKRLYLETFGLR